MRYSYWLFSVTILSFMLCVGGCGQPAQPGCATPAEVMTRESAALKNGNRDDLARCFAAYSLLGADAGKSAADMVWLSNDMKPVIIAGVKKFGVNGFEAALGFVTSLAITGIADFSLSNISGGQLHINGTKAMYNVKFRRDDDRISSKAPEWDQFQRANVRDCTMTKRLEQVNGRWYDSAPKITNLAQLKLMQSASQGLADYIPQLQKSINTCKDAQTLQAALIEPNKKLEAALKPWLSSGM